MPSAPVAFIQGSLWWYMAALAVLSILIGAGKMAWEQRGDPGREVLKGLLTLVVVSGAGVAFIALGVAAFDEFAVWIIDRSVQDGEFGENLVRLLTVPVAGTLARVLVIVLGLVSVFVSLVQIGLMVARNGMLVILAGVLPTSGSFTSTEIGKAQFQKLVAWLIAFMLYKPAAAIVYATALSGVNLFGDEGLISLVTGMVLMVLAVLALPALMRFAGPVVGAVASAGGGGGQVAAAGATVAAGAIPVSRGSSGGGWDAAPSGAPGPHGQGSDQGPSGAHSSNGAGGESANGGGGGGCGVEQRHRATARSGPRGAGVATLRGGRGDGRIWRVVAVWGMGRRSAVRWAVGRWSGGWVWARGLGSRAMGCLSTTGA